MRETNLKKFLCIKDKKRVDNSCINYPYLCDEPIRWIDL